MLSDHLPILRVSPFFAGFADDEILHLLSCFRAVERVCARGEVVMRAGEKTGGRAGFIVEGHIDTIEEDFWGNETLLGRFSQGQVFADAFLLAGRNALPFTAVSYRRSILLMIEFRLVLTPCDESCALHQRLLRNLLPIYGEKVIYLLELLSFITKRTLREKLLSYLSAQAVKAGSDRFDINLNRQGLANYLAVDRSALSAELGRMQKDGLITFTKNHFQLHSRE